MEDLAQRIGLFVMEHVRARGAAFWIAIWFPIAVAICIPLFADRHKKTSDAQDDLDFSPKQRAPLPRSFDRGDTP